MGLITQIGAGLAAIVLWEFVLRRAAVFLLTWVKQRYLWNRFFGLTGNVLIAKSTRDFPHPLVRQSDILVEQEIRPRLRKSIKLIGDDPRFDIERPSANLIVIGSPRYNRYAELLQRHFKLAYEYVFDSYETDPAQQILKIISQYGDEYGSSHDLRTNRSPFGVDYGILFLGRIHDYRIYWISGIHGPGTMGVLSYLQKHPDLFSPKFPKLGDYGESWVFRIQYDREQYERGREDSLTMVEKVELIGGPHPGTSRHIDRPPRALMCDLGNVVMLFDRARTYRALGHSLGIPYQGVADTIEQSGLRERYENGEITDREFYRMIMELLEASDEPSYEVFSEFWGDIFWPNRNMVNALRLISEQLKLVLVSNTNNLHFSNIQEHYGDILSLFGDRMVLSYREKKRKPNHALFQKALESVGKGTAYGECIYVDDKAEFVRTAEDLGMQGIIFYSYPQFVYHIRQLGLYIP